MADKARIVIIGGGVAGIEVATSLGRGGKAEVVLADRSLSHVWKPMLHTFAAGTARPDRQKVDFFAQARRNGFRFQPGTLIASNWSSSASDRVPISASAKRPMIRSISRMPRCQDRYRRRRRRGSRSALVRVVPDIGSRLPVGG